MGVFMNHLEYIIKLINQPLNSFIWGPFMLAAFLFIGIMFTIRTGFFQIRHFHCWMNATVFQLFKKENKNVIHTNDKHAISQFQSLCTGLAATIGIGNITGVATAITIGGPGSVFWMWLSAFFGMMTNYAEITLGIKYRYKNKEKNWVGGPFVYIERGLGKRFRWLAVLFAILCMFASFGIGNMTQVNSIANGLKNSFHINPKYTAVVVIILGSMAILGDIKRIASVTEKVVPFMSILYVLGSFIVIGANTYKLPFIFTQILKEAFNFRAMGSGTIGYGILLAAKVGISRGVFSNEAGLGSTVIIHSSSDVREPVTQGMWGIFQVFTDTIIMCTITALTILSSGVYNLNYTIHALKSGKRVITGTALTSAAFSSVIPFGDKFVAIAIFLFAFSTILGWSYYGSVCAEYLFGFKAIFIYKILFILIIYIGCTSSLELVWEISDTLNGFMAIPNLIAITLLSGEVVKMTKDYLRKKEKEV